MSNDTTTEETREETASAESAPGTSDGSSEDREVAVPDAARSDENAADASADVVEVVEPAAPALPWEAALPFGKGDTVEGNVVKIDLETVILDLGLPVEGVMPIREVVQPPHTFAEEVVSIGESVKALVTSLDAPDGHPRLSLTRLAEQEVWDRLAPSLDAGEPITARVSEVVKGGLRLDVGVEAFLPASLVDVRPVGDLSPFLGQELTCRVIEADPKRRKLVLSRKAVLEEERAAKAEELFASLQEGSVVTGTVSSVTDIGLFVDVGGADGLVHSSEIGWGRSVHPKKVAKPGDRVEVKVLSVDRDKRRIGLSMKQLAENPWDSFVRAHSVGEVVTGKVVKNADFGSFVEVTPGVEGLVHVSELSEGRVDKPADVVNVGDEIEVRITEIDLARDRLGLSVRAVTNPEPVSRSHRGGPGGPKGGRRKERRGKGTQSFGESSDSGLQSQISAKSMRALDALKAQLATDSDEG